MRGWRWCELGTWPASKVEPIRSLFVRHVKLFHLRSRAPCPPVPLSVVRCRDCLPPPLGVSSLVPEVHLTKSRNTKSLLLSSLALLVPSSSPSQAPTPTNKLAAAPPSPQSNP